MHTNPEPIQVRDLITELQRHDPATYVHFIQGRGEEIFIEHYEGVPGKLALGVVMSGENDRKALIGDIVDVLNSHGAEIDL